MNSFESDFDEPDMTQVWKGAVAGLAGGLIATWAMRLIPKPAPQPDEKAVQDATVTAASAIIEGESLLHNSIPTARTRVFCGVYKSTGGGESIRCVADERANIVWVSPVRQLGFSRPRYCLRQCYSDHGRVRCLSSVRW